VNRITWRAVKLGVTVSATAGIVALASSGAHALLLDVYLLVIGAVILLALVRATRAQVPAERRSPFDRALAATRSRPPDSGELALVRELELSTYNAFHLHARLRPVLREVAELRLAGRGIALDGEEAAAHAALGPRLWDVVRADRPAPADPAAPGLPPAVLHELVERLEAI
jgi:hypothetical protein